MEALFVFYNMASLASGDYGSYDIDLKGIINLINRSSTEPVVVIFEKGSLVWLRSGGRKRELPVAPKQ